MWARRLLRLVEEQARDEALSSRRRAAAQPTDSTKHLRALDRAGRGLELVLMDQTLVD
jgi:hypothetical protein